MLTPINRVKECRHGKMTFDAQDDPLGRSLDLYGEWAEGEVELFRQILYPENVVVEVGANIGAHTIFLAKAVVPYGKVLAFESQPMQYQTLCANVTLNSLVNVETHNSVLSDGPGEFQITLDSLNLPQCDLLKVHAEGRETKILKGAAATLTRCQPLLYIENDREEKSKDLLRTIDSFGYKMFWHMPNWFQPNNFAGNSENVFGKAGGFNLFCVPKTNLNYNLEPFQPVMVPPA